MRKRIEGSGRNSKRKGKWKGGPEKREMEVRGRKEGRQEEG